MCSQIHCDHFITDIHHGNSHNIIIMNMVRYSDNNTIMCTHNYFT